jgi:hypothetical protein
MLPPAKVQQIVKKYQGTRFGHSARREPQAL